MEKTAELAGFFAAHAVWCVSEGGLLTPMLTIEMPDGSRQMHRLVTNEYGKAIHTGYDKLASNQEGAHRAVFIYEGGVTVPTGKKDGLIVEARLFGLLPKYLTLIIPHRNAENPNAFTVRPPELLSYDAVESDRTLLLAFFRGVEQHEKGAEVWSAHLDGTESERALSAPGNTLHEQVLRDSLRAMEGVKKQYGVDLDYSTDSVALVENILDEYHVIVSEGGVSQGTIESIGYAFGSYLGEAIRRRWGGKWSPVTEDGEQIITLYVCHFDTFPMNKVFQRLQYGRVDNLMDYLKLIEHTCTAALAWPD